MKNIIETIGGAIFATLILFVSFKLGQQHGKQQIKKLAVNAGVARTDFEGNFYWYKGEMSYEDANKIIWEYHWQKIMFSYTISDLALSRRKFSVVEAISE